MTDGAQISMDELRTVLEAIGESAAARRSSGDVEVFDPLTPHRFTPPQMNGLKDFAEQASRNLTATMSAVLRGAFRISLHSITQEFAHRFAVDGTPSYVTFRSGESPIGFLMLPAETALAWTDKLLGGRGEVANGVREMSALELDLLLDLSEKVIGAISSASVEADGPQLTPIRDVSETVPEIPAPERIPEYCRIRFQRDGEADPVTFDVLILSRMLEPIAGLLRPEALNEDEVRLRMMGHVERVSMGLTVQLDAPDVALRDLASLESGDVMLLRTRVNQPVSVLVSGKVIMNALPVEHKGQYGVQVLDFVEAGGADADESDGRN